MLQQLCEYLYQDLKEDENVWLEHFRIFRIIKLLTWLAPPACFEIPSTQLAWSCIIYMEMLLFL